MGKLIVLPVMIVVIVGFWGLIIFGLKTVFGSLMKTRLKADLYDTAQSRATAEENRALKEALAELLAERRERQAREATQPRRAA